MAEKRKFAALAELHQQQHEAPSVPSSPAVPADVPVSESPRAGRGRPSGKRSNPDFQPTTVLLRKATKRAAIRKLEDAEARQDLCDLIEQLLTTWIEERS